VAAILFNGLGRYEEALAAAEQAGGDTPELFLPAWALPELIEAGVRSGTTHPSRTRLRPELARAHLLHGEWLRREGRRAEAREQLRTAHDTFAAIGMDAFAERARHELLATGEKVRTRTTETRDELTPQEEQIARLARDGLSNPEIGARLFLSPRTVEWHLHKVFAKLGISSRNGLHDAMPTQDGNAALG
jgi:DNA-binding NarL/FixJ family response regulator